MPIPAAVAALLAPLLKNGLNLLGNAVLAKGKDYVEEKFGVTLGPDLTPDQVVALKQAEMEHEQELRRIEIEDRKLTLSEIDMMHKDVEGAREREIKIATSDKAPLLNKLITPILALTVLLLTFILFGIVMFDPDPVDSTRKDLLVYVLGVLSAISTQIVGYYFGSSMGSKEKQEVIDRVLK
jgi:hypothetical protein